MIFSQDREGCFLLSAHLKLNKSRVFLGLPFIQPGGVKTTISITWVGETKVFEWVRRRRRWRWKTNGERIENCTLIIELHGLRDETSFYEGILSIFYFPIETAWEKQRVPRIITIIKEYLMQSSRHDYRHGRWMIFCVSAKAKGGFESCRKSAIDGRPEATNEGWQKRQRKTCRAVNESKHDVDYSQKMDGRTDSVSQRLRTKLTRSSHVRHLIQVNMLYAFA